MTDTIRFRINVRTTTEGNAKEHWRTKAKRAKAQIEATAWAYIAATGGTSKLAMLPFPRTRVTLTRIAPGKLDAHDNLPSSQKHVVDALAKCFGVDDADERVEWRYEQRKGARGEYAVIVAVEPAAETQQRKAVGE